MTPSGRAPVNREDDHADARRIGMVYTIFLLVGLAQMSGLVIIQLLQPVGSIDLGFVDLRLTFNAGVAFSMGADWPPVVLLTLTGLVIGALIVLLMRRGPVMSLTARIAGSAVVAGAISNFMDRLIRGSVADYFHTGWFPTFNLADIFITVGGIIVAISLLRSDAPNRLGVDSELPPAGEAAPQHPLPGRNRRPEDEQPKDDRP